MKQKINNGYKGITLLSLVITIILMLILAGVVLNFSIGERGIFNHAKSTKDIQKIAEYKDNVEISRTGVAVDNLGKVTLDKLIEEIYKDNIVEEGSISKLNDTQAKMITPEGYVFIITGEGIEYIDKKENIPNVDLAEGTIEFAIEPEGWTNKNIKVIITKNTNEDLTIKYSYDKTTWNTYTKEIEIEENKTIYACLENKLGEKGSYTTFKITNIDKIEPTISSIKATPSAIIATNATIQTTLQDADSGLSKIIWEWGTSTNYGSSATSTYSDMNGSEKGSIISEIKTYELTGLNAGTKYYVRITAYDVAGNPKQSTTTFTTNLAIASYNNVKYTSITNALNAVSTSGTITMIANTTENVTIPSNKNIVLALNNKTITGTITNNGVLTINGQGTVTSNANQTIINTGTFNLNSGYINCRLGWAIYNTKTFNMNGGTVNLQLGNADGAAILNANSMNINGGEIHSPAYAVVIKNNGTSIIKNSQITNSHSNIYPIHSESGGIVQIYNSTITNTLNNKRVYSSVGGRFVLLYNCNLGTNLNNMFAGKVFSTNTTRNGVYNQVK